VKATFRIHEGDCRNIIPSIKKNSIQLALTSPPYCLGQDYEKGATLDDLELLIHESMDLLVRRISEGGSVCWQVGYHVNNGSLIPLDYIIYKTSLDHDCLKLKNRIIWTFGHGPHCKTRFSGRHETVLWFTKGEGFTFDLDSVRVPQKYPGKRHYKGPKKGSLSGNPLGKNPADVWNIPNVKFNHVEKTDHPCQFPFALAERLVLALTRKGDTVLDPFVGSGTSGAAALHHSRNFIGIDSNKEYCDIARKRLIQAKSGALEFRPISLPIYDPANAGNIAKVPENFQLDRQRRHG